MNEKMAAFIALLENEDIGERIKAAPSVEDVIVILAENGVNITSDELKEIAVPLNAALNGDELDESALDAVAGGVNWWKVGKFIATVVGAICDLLK